MTRKLVLLALWGGTALPILFGCGGDTNEPKAPVAKETPAGEVLRISSVWGSTGTDKGLLSPPSPISVFEVTEASKITLGPTQAKENLTVEEEVRLRNGAHLTCRTTVDLPLQIRWGTRQGEPAVELTRAPISVPRQCDHPGHPDAALERPGGAVRFVLRSDSLVAVEPATDGRVYLPTN